MDSVKGPLRGGGGAETNILTRTIGGPEVHNCQKTVTAPAPCPDEGGEGSSGTYSILHIEGHKGRDAARLTIWLAAGGRRAKISKVALPRNVGDGCCGSPWERGEANPLKPHLQESISDAKRSGRLLKERPAGVEPEKYPREGK